MGPRPALLVALTALVGCGPPPAPAAPAIPVEGPARDRRTLEGEWRGEFTGAGRVRQGTILFTLAAGRDTARGEIVIEDAGPLPACTDAVSTAVQVAKPGTGVTVLRLGGVVVAEGSVAGWVQSYPDFEVGCPVDTWFEGRLVRDTLQGMFFAHPAAGDTVRRGTWWAARR